VSTAASSQPERFQLFQRTGSTKWQMRFSVRGQGQLKRSLDTDDRGEAERRADAIWYEATYRAKQGLTARAHSFEAVAEGYIAQILREVERGERRADQGKSEPSMIRRFFIGYFGSKPVDAITDTDLERYATGPRVRASSSSTSSTSVTGIACADPCGAQHPPSAVSAVRPLCCGHCCAGLHGRAT
jgi:hypothetical protein